MAELFGVQRPAITKHLKNIFESGELEEDSVSSIMEHTAEDESCDFSSPSICFSTDQKNIVFDVLFNYICTYIMRDLWKLN